MMGIPWCWPDRAHVHHTHHTHHTATDSQYTLETTSSIGTRSLYFLHPSSNILPATTSEGTAHSTQSLPVKSPMKDSMFPQSCQPGVSCAEPSITIVRVLQTTSNTNYLRKIRSLLSSRLTIPLKSSPPLPRLVQSPSLVTLVLRQIKHTCLLLIRASAKFSAAN